MTRLLLVEEDTHLGSLLQNIFTKYDMRCDVVGSEPACFSRLNKIRNDPDHADYDVIIYDTYSIGRFAHRVRNYGYTGKLLVITSSDDKNSEIEALSHGVDAIIRRPFEIREIVAMVYALLRRRYHHCRSVIQTGRLKLDMETKAVYIDDIPISLTKKEYLVLELLFIRKGVTISKVIFFHHLYDPETEVTLKILDVFICKVRKKLGKTIKNINDYIRTDWGRGYKLVDLEPINVLSSEKKKSADYSENEINNSNMNHNTENLSLGKNSLESNLSNEFSSSNYNSKEASNSQGGSEDFDSDLNLMDKKFLLKNKKLDHDLSAYFNRKKDLFSSQKVEDYEVKNYNKNFSDENLEFVSSDEDFEYFRVKKTLNRFKREDDNVSQSTEDSDGKFMSSNNSVNNISHTLESESMIDDELTARVLEQKKEFQRKRNNNY